MSRKSQVKAAIDAKIKQNGKQEITGPVLNGVLTSMLDASLMDIKDAEGNTLPRDAEGNAILPQVASQSELDAEVTRAQSAEGMLANSISGEVARAQAAETLIAGLASSKLTRVDLACDGYEPLKITYRGETEALTFQEVYDLVTDKSKFVTLLDSEMFILLPSLSIDGDAIEFAGINVMSHQAEAQRVIINQENQVSVYPIELEDSDRKVSSAEGISGADALIKYPNVKALQDYVAAHGGGLTPEQEAKLNAAITDAPLDGKQYARKDGAWAEVQGGERVEMRTYTITEADVTNVRIDFTNGGEYPIENVKEVICQVMTNDGSTLSSYGAMFRYGGQNITRYSFGGHREGVTSIKRYSNKAVSTQFTSGNNSLLLPPLGGHYSTKNVGFYTFAELYGTSAFPIGLTITILTVLQ